MGASFRGFMAALRSVFFRFFLFCAGGVLSWVVGCGGSHGEGSDAVGAAPGDGGGGSGAVGPGGASSAGGTGSGPVGPCSADADCAGLEAPQCWVAVCNTGSLPGPVAECYVVPSDAGGCDDGLFCTVGDTCVEGACVGAPNTCGMEPGICEDIACDEAAQACAPQAAADGADCDNGDLCLIDPSCEAGACVGIVQPCAQQPDSCVTNTCNPSTGLCEELVDPAKDGAFCVGDLCHFGATCDSGACVGGEPIDCSYVDFGCQVGVCNPTFGFCDSAPVPEGDPCVPVEAACNTGTCDAAGACQPTPVADGIDCSDDNACTIGETCSAGQCTNGVVLPLEVYFEDDFSSNAAGWQLDTEWAIGATATDPMSFAPDPAFDHSPTADNGVAGAVLGGDVSFAMHPYYYLTSPSVDVSAASGPLYLEFWRWLNTEFPPYMENSIDVWDGASWVNLWKTDDFTSVFDVAWTKQAIDITAYKNAALRVRFGHAAPQDGFFGYSGWNIDDVKLANQSCD